ncbi:MAG: hypothetical protein AAF420_03460 [Pseudomonadota bacterium]
MTPSWIDAGKLDPSAVGEILDLIAQLKRKLFFLIDLNSGYCNTQITLGNGGQAFVEQALELARAQPNCLPVHFELQDLIGELELLRRLEQIELNLIPLHESLDQAKRFVAGSVYFQALQIHACREAYGEGALQRVAGDPMKNASSSQHQDSKCSQLD